MKLRGLEVTSEWNVGNFAVAGLPDSHAGVYRCKPPIQVTETETEKKNLKKEVVQGIVCVRGKISSCLSMNETLWSLSRQ